MFIRVFLVTILLAFLSACYAAPSDNSLLPFDVLLAFRARAPTLGLNLKRQTSSTNTSVPLSAFPTQCQQGCAPAVTAINTCNTTACICNPTVDSSFAFCLSCSVNANPTTSVIQTAQQLATTYNSLCTNSGVSSITFTVTASTVTASTNTSVTTISSISSTSANIVTTPTTTPQGPTTTIGPVQTAPSTSTSILTTPSSTNTRNNAPIVRPHVAFTSIGLVMLLLMSVL